MKTLRRSLFKTKVKSCFPFGFLSGSKARSFIVAPKLWVMSTHSLSNYLPSPVTLASQAFLTDLKCAPMATYFSTSLFWSNITFSIKMPWKIPSKIIIVHHCFGTVGFIIFWCNLFIYNVYCLYLSPHLEYELHKDREHCLLGLLMCPNFILWQTHFRLSMTTFWIGE